MHALRKLVCGLMAVLLLCALVQSAAFASGSGDELDAFNSPNVTIGVPTGSATMNAVEARFPNANIKYYTLDTDGYMAVTSGKLDAFAYDTVLLKYACEENSQLRLLDSSFGDADISVGISRKSSGLTEPVNAFIRELVDSGVRDDMFRRWLLDADNAMPELETPTAPEMTIRVGTSGVVTPMTYYGADGVLTGFDIELMRRMALSLNAKLEISVMNYDALVAGLESGKLDMVVANLNITPERAERIDYSIPYKTAANGLVVRKETADGAAAAVSGLPDPATARIGAQTGTSFESLAMERFPDADYKSFSSLDSCMLSLKSGQIDYAVAANLDALYHKEVDNGYCLAEPPLKEIKVCAAISKEKPELLEKVDELLLKYEEDGTLDRMYSNWYEVEGHDYIQEDVPILTEGETLKVVINSNNEPNAFVSDGVLCGYDIELVRRIASDLGMQVEYVDVETAAMVPALVAGKGDMVLCGLTWTEERAEKVLFSRPYITLSTVLVYYDSGAATTEGGGFFDSLASSFRKNFVVENRWKLLLSGIGVTLLLSVSAGLAGIVIGFVLCLMRMSRSKALGGTATLITKILQGTPLVVLLMIMYYVIFNKTGLDGVAVAIITFGLSFGAYASVIMLSGINAVEKGQREAAAAIGFSPAKTFIKIVFPQAARHFLPVLKGEYISLVKMTSIVGYVAVQDLTKVSDIIRSRTYEAFFPLIVTAVIYFLLAFGLSSLLGLIEVRIDPKRRPRTVKGVEL